VTPGMVRVPHPTKDVWRPAGLPRPRWDRLQGPEAADAPPSVDSAPSGSVVTPPRVPPTHGANPPSVRRRPRGVATGYPHPLPVVPDRGGPDSRALSPPARGGAPRIHSSWVPQPHDASGSATHPPRPGRAGPPRIPLGNSLGSWRRPRPCRWARLSLAATTRGRRRWILWVNGPWRTTNETRPRGEPSAGAAQRPGEAPTVAVPCAGQGAEGLRRSTAAQPPPLPPTPSADAGRRTSVGAQGQAGLPAAVPRQLAGDLSRSRPEGRWR